MLNSIPRSNAEFKAKFQFSYRLPSDAFKTTQETMFMSQSCLSEDQNDFKQKFEPPT